MSDPKSRLQAQVQALKFEAIMGVVNQLLAQKGYDAMTMDEVAEQAGMSKASLYKLFPSKEELAAQAMVRVLDLALARVDALRRQEDADPLDCLMQVTRWAMQTKLEGEMPSLPAQNSSLSAALSGHEPYMERLLDLSMKLGVWVAQAQQTGRILAHLPSEFVLYQLYARACDPVLGVMKADGQYRQDQILDWMLDVQFRGLCAPAAAQAQSRNRPA